MDKYRRAVPDLSTTEKSSLIAYVAIVVGSISIAPDQANLNLSHAQFLVDWIPAANRMLEISKIPGKTLAWLVSSLLSTPLVFFFALSRFRDKESYSWKLKQMKTILVGLLLIAMFLTPWFFVTAYREDMKRAGAIVSAMGNSVPVLAVVGSGISLVCALVCASTFVVAVRVLGIKKSH